jgi:hypothetical protein
MCELRRTTQVAVFAAVAFVSGSTTAFAGVNSLGLSYNAYTNDSSYDNPTGMLISGYCNSNNVAFQNARAAGAEVLEYVDPVDIPDTLPSCA